MQQGYTPPGQEPQQRKRRSSSSPAPQQYQQPQVQQQQYPQYQLPQQYQPAYQAAPVGGLRCNNCGGTNVQVSMVNSAMDTRNRGRGCLWRLGRTLLIVFTFGLWLVVGKSKGKSKTKIKSTKTAVCQTCGNSWAV